MSGAPLLEPPWTALQLDLAPRSSPTGAPAPRQRRTGAGPAAGVLELRQVPLRETFHIEVLGPEADEVQTRISVRVGSLETAQERALRLFARARVPQRSGEPAQAVRVIDGAGREVFFRSRFDSAD